MTYHNAEKYIKNAASDTQTNCSPERLKFYLDEILQQYQKTPYIRFAGTNGKSSCIAMLSSIMKDASYKSCALSFSEEQEPKYNILIDGLPIDREEFALAMTKIHVLGRSLEKKLDGKRDPAYTIRENIPESILSRKISHLLTRREILFVAAMIVSKDVNCDLLFIEASNNIADPSLILKSPVATVVCGAIPENDRDALRMIRAYIHPGVSEVVCAPQSTSAYRTIADYCASANSRLSVPVRSELTVTRLFLMGTEFSYFREPFKLKLCGRFQTINAITVLETVKLLRRYGFTVSSQSEKKGLAATTLTSRFDVICLSPKIFVDCTHTNESIEVVCESLFDLSEITGRRLSLCLPPKFDIIETFLEALKKRGYHVTSLITACTDQDTIKVLQSKFGADLEVLTMDTPRRIAEAVKANMDDSMMLISGDFLFADTVGYEIKRVLNF